MGALAKITISLPEEMLAEVKAAVEAGEFTNTSEAIRDALRQWRRARSVMASLVFVNSPASTAALTSASICSGSEIVIFASAPIEPPRSISPQYEDIILS